MPTSSLVLTTPHALPLAPDLTGRRHETVLDQATQLEAFISGLLNGGGTLWLAYDATATAAQAAATLTFASVAAGTVVMVNGVRFVAVSGTPVRTNNEFKRGVSDTADAADFVTTVNACTDARISGIVVATSAAAVVTLKAQTAGALGNALMVKLYGVVASGTVTYSSSSGAQTVVINGVTVYNATGASDAANATAAAAAINASSNALVLGHVLATSSAGVVTIYAAYAGVRGNAVTLAATGTGATASGARLTGGALAQGEGVQASGTVTISGADGGTYATTINGVTINATGTNGNDTATAASIVTAIQASTNALVRGLVVASSSVGVVTITATRGGISGNTITLAATGTGATASGTRLTGGVVPTTVVIGSATPVLGSSPTEANLAAGVGGATPSSISM